MKRRFSEEQIIYCPTSDCEAKAQRGIFKEHEAGVPARELCRKHGMLNASFYKWKAKFSGMEGSDARRLSDLESENEKLKRLVADLSLDKMALEDVPKK